MTATVKSAPPRARIVGDKGSTIRLVSAQTGLPMQTLRAWERRYGFPKPARRADSNRRLYSGDDVVRLVAIQRALGAGYRVGDVIEKSLSDLRELATAPLSADATGVVDKLLVALEHDDVGGLESLLRGAAGSLGHRRFVTEVAQPFAVAVGAGWASGRFSVRHEHVATECLVTQLRQLLAGYQDVVARPLVLLATLPGEVHTLPLQMVALYLFVLGAKPRLLGGNTPAADLLETVVALDADAVGITVTETCDHAQTRKAVAWLRRKLPARVPIWLGGDGASKLRFDDERTRVVSSWEAIERCVSLVRA
jgi:MerR family transcriptional regulator, light-induced transcriptional regulator